MCVRPVTYKRKSSGAAHRTNWWYDSGASEAESVPVLRRLSSSPVPCIRRNTACTTAVCSAASLPDTEDREGGATNPSSAIVAWKSSGSVGVCVCVFDRKSMPGNQQISTWQQRDEQAIAVWIVDPTPRHDCTVHQSNAYSRAAKIGLCKGRDQCTTTHLVTPAAPDVDRRTQTAFASPECPTTSRTSHGQSLLAAPSAPHVLLVHSSLTTIHPQVKQQQQQQRRRQRHQR
jgi:hypothetical protein